MKSLIKHTGLSVLIVICISLFLSGCNKDTNNFELTKSKVSGYAQKGPFVNGTTILMYELNSSLDQTGKVFNTEITNNRGSFELNDVNISSQYVQFAANGYYYNEILGEVSSSLLNLNALADITDISTVNVNILTHLEKARVEYLIDDGKTFTEAKETAQSDVLAIFGYQLADMNPSELLDMSVNKAENAILIAISVILQGNRTIGDLTELMANIITDIRQDGILNNNDILNKLIGSASELDQSAIRTNLQNRYTELGFIVTIPNFEQYIYDFISQKGTKPTISDIGYTVVAPLETVLTGIVNPGGLATTVIFEFGETTDYGQEVGAGQNPVTGSSNTAVSASVYPEPGKLYHFRIRANNILGTTYSSDRMFTATGGPLSATTGDYLYPSSDGALLIGYVNPNGIPTNVHFAIGTTTDYEYMSEWRYGLTGNSPLSIQIRVSELIPDTEYHYRIWAANDYFGIVLGEDKTFRTLGTINDIEGNIYKIVELPDGIWMAENLRTTKYNNGDIIETTIPDTLSLQNDTTIAQYQWAYNGDENIASIYGRLYTWYAIMDSRGVCPTGWHIPSLEEWTALSTSLGGNSISGGKLKEKGHEHWLEWNGDATNESGFTALPGGNRRLFTSPIFNNLGVSGFWWSSTENSQTLAYWVQMVHWSTWFYIKNPTAKKSGFSIRCIKDK